MPKKKNPTSKRTHVVKRDTGWAVKKEGTKRASRVHRTKNEAINDANRGVNPSFLTVYNSVFIEG